MRGLYRELQNLHSRINSIIQSPALTAPATVKDDFAATDVDTNAKIATAINQLAVALNANTAAVTELLAVFNSVPN